MKKKIFIIAGAITISIGIGLGCWGLSKYLSQKNAGAMYEDLKEDWGVEPILDIPQVGENEENPVDFKELTAKYPDVYAWIRIPGTNVDYPIVQREGDNAYYLNHTIDGRKRIEGAIFTEDYNNKDFEDPNTLIYGHNMLNGSMFRTLHKFKDRKFFDENRDVYIYQDGKILKYRIFAAYTYDDRHIMMSFDFEDEKIFEIYLNSVLTNRGMSDNIDTGISVTTKDKIITMSTCTSNQSQRYLVQAVLVSIQE